jgi:hypothetical protein
MNALRGELSEVSGASIQPIVHQVDAAQIAHQQPFSEGCRADLVVTSPPYPGIHVLYHRWQVDGRKETPAPYWVASSRDGEGGSYYTFGDRRRPDSIYFDRLRSTLTGIRAAMREGAYFVQAVAFKDPTSQLAKYLRAMESAGFEEIRRRGTRHIRRSVPGRRWHAFQKGQTPSSQEVVLIHRAR